MEYVLLRYRDRPDCVVDVVATSRPDEAVRLVRRWSRRSPDEGLIVAIGARPIVHCTPHGR